METRTDKDSINLKLKVKYNLRFESIACPPAMSRTGFCNARAWQPRCGPNYEFRSKTGRFYESRSAKAVLLSEFVQHRCQAWVLHGVLFASAQPLECRANLRVDRVGQLEALRPALGRCVGRGGRGQAVDVLACAHRVHPAPLRDVPQHRVR